MGGGKGREMDNKSNKCVSFPSIGRCLIYCFQTFDSKRDCTSLFGNPDGNAGKVRVPGNGREHLMQVVVNVLEQMKRPACSIYCIAL